MLTTLCDTLGAAQALIDLNRVADVSLIGVADSPECSAYVASGVIAAALVMSALNNGMQLMGLDVAFQKIISRDKNS